MPCSSAALEKSQLIAIIPLPFYIKPLGSNTQKLNCELILFSGETSSLIKFTLNCMLFWNLHNDVRFLKFFPGRTSRPRWTSNLQYNIYYCITCKHPICKRGDIKLNSRCMNFRKSFHLLFPEFTWQKLIHILWHEYSYCLQF